MVPVITLLVILVVNVALTRVATVALVHTGMGREAARFQARSAFTGVGFTTSEAESIVAHPVRRRIIMWLMLVGNIGIVAVLASVLLSFVDLDMSGNGWAILGALTSGLLLVAAFSSNDRVEHAMSQVISTALNRWSELDTRDYARLLHLREDYGVDELRVEADDWVAGKTLHDAGLDQEGVLVLGVECSNGHFIGAPSAETQVRPGDRLILYGRTPRIRELDSRPPGAGDGMHSTAVSDQARISGEEHMRAGRRRVGQTTARARRHRPDGHLCVDSVLQPRPVRG